MSYKINIHSHTIFSDGMNTPYHMALEAKRLGFTALVITDHFYDSDTPVSIDWAKMELLRKACREAKKILPVIIGLEIPLLEEEVLVFGGAMVNHILQTGLPNPIDLMRMKALHGCATILCHPGSNYQALMPLVDGVEHYNSGNNWMVSRNFSVLKGKPRWCNSDAHGTNSLEIGYNIVDTKIQTEHDLIGYIKRKSQPDFCVRGKVIQGG